MRDRASLRAGGSRGVRALFAALAVAGCSSTSLDNMWKEPAHAGRPMSNLLVICERQNAAARRIWEDAFVDGLKDKGVMATPSYRLFPGALPDTLQVDDKVRENGYDGVLIVARLRPSVSTRYVPGYTTTQPVTVYNHWRGYYTTRYREMYTPGYTEVDKVARNEIMLWSTGNDAHMIWTGTTSTLNPDDADQIVKEVTATVIPQLGSAHFLGVR